MLSLYYTKTSDIAWCNDKNTDHSRDLVLTDNQGYHYKSW